jgi:transcriptional regulator with XRE-family HTH domain
MKINERLKQAIEAKRGNLARISKLTGLSLEGVRKIADGRTANPGIYTVQNIEAALDKIEAEAPAGPSVTEAV